MDTQGQISMKALKHTIELDPYIWPETCHDNCIKIHPKSRGSTRAAYSIKLIKNRIINNELPGLVLKDCFTRRNVFTITVCVQRDRNHCYKTLIETIENHDLRGLHLYEHH